MGQEQKRITGTHVYTMLRCPRAVALDLFEDRDQRRPLTEAEEFVRQRGRDWEAKLVAELGYPEPEFEKRDWRAGADATEALLRQGLDGISQGILLLDDQLGIPDLLRKEPGESAFGDYHYVVGDIKTSARPRSDQVLQVAFYSRMLARLQQREPEYGYLILKDGHEERFVLAEIEAALDDVLDRIRAVRDRPDRERPFLSQACGHCHWSSLCLAELQDADDLSLVQGMTRGVRKVLERCGLVTCASVAEMAIEPTARRSHLEPTLLRRLKRAARAHVEGRPLPEKGNGNGLEDAALVHMLTDAYAERVLFFGVLSPARVGGEFFGVCPEDAATELDAFLSLVDRLPPGVPLLHYDRSLPRWFTEAARGRPRTAAIEARFVNVQKKLRGAAVYPGPVFSMGDHVRYVLGVDPDREGQAGAAACWVAKGESGRLQSKCQSDLEDLSRVLQEVAAREKGQAAETAADQAADQAAEQGAG